MKKENYIAHLEDCIKQSRADNTWVFVRKDVLKKTIALLKEQEAEVKAAYRRGLESGRTIKWD